MVAILSKISSSARITSLAELQSGELARFGYESVSVLLCVFLTDVLGKI